MFINSRPGLGDAVEAQEFMHFYQIPAVMQERREAAAFIAATAGLNAEQRADAIRTAAQKLASLKTAFANALSTARSQWAAYSKAAANKRSALLAKWKASVAKLKSLAAQINALSPGFVVVGNIEASAKSASVPSTVAPVQTSGSKLFVPLLIGAAFLM